jgi:hypothetical protein
METAEEVVLFFANMVLVEDETEDTMEEEPVERVNVEKEYELWLIREKEKRLLACANSRQKVKYVLDEEEYILQKDRMGRMTEGSEK